MSDHDQMTALLGGERFAAALKDGTIEQVTIRELPIRDLQRALMSMGDDAKLVELYCDKPNGWSDQLTLQSALEILTAGHRINQPFFAEYIRVKNDLLQRVAPELAKKLQDTGRASLDGSPESRSDPG